MKKNVFFQNKKKDLKAFAVSTLVVVGVGYFCFANVFEASSPYHHHQMSANKADASLAQNSNTVQWEDVRDAMVLLQEINEEKMNLENKKEKVATQLEKAKNERDSYHGMVPGTCFSAPQGLPEVISLEQKMNSIDSEISSLTDTENNIVAKYGNDIRFSLMTLALK